MQSFGGRLDKTDFQKLLFLYCDYTKTNYYDFFPHKYGCFSFLSYQDKRVLTEQGYLKNIDKFELKKKVSFTLKQSDKENISEFSEKFKKLKGKPLIRHTYIEHPYLAIKSEIAHRILTSDELKKIIAQKRDDQRGIFTIGYEGLTIDAYINKLIKNNIHLVIDVRKNPLSMKYGFSKTRMKTYLQKAGITYVHLPELGIVSHLRQNLESPRDYEKLFDYYSKKILPEQVEYLNIIIEHLDKYNRIALTCFEAEHNSCHRHKITNWIAENYSKEKIQHL